MTSTDRVSKNLREIRVLLLQFSVLKYSDLGVHIVEIAKTCLSCKCSNGFMIQGNQPEVIERIFCHVIKNMSRDKQISPTNLSLKIL